MTLRAGTTINILIITNNTTINTHNPWEALAQTPRLLRLLGQGTAVGLTWDQHLAHRVHPMQTRR